MVATSDLTATKPGTSFKRLGFVRDYSSFYLTKSSALASHAWQSTVHFAPASLQPRLKSVEDVVADYSNPTWVRLQDKSDSVLHLLDDKVRSRRCAGPCDHFACQHRSIGTPGYHRLRCYRWTTQQ